MIVCQIKLARTEFTRYQMKINQTDALIIGGELAKDGSHSVEASAFRKKRRIASVRSEIMQ